MQKISDHFAAMKYPTVSLTLESGEHYGAAVVLLMIRNGQFVAVNPAYTDPFDAMPREYIMEGEPEIHYDGRIIFDNGFINDDGRNIGYKDITDEWRKFAVERSGSEGKERARAARFFGGTPLE